MIHSAYNLIGYRLQAADGEIGKVHDLYFDDDQHEIRYVVADTGNWLPGRRVLLAPLTVESIDTGQRKLIVKTSRKAIEDSPPISDDLPVSRQHERDLAQHFGWPYYWSTDPSLGIQIATNDYLPTQPSGGVETVTSEDDDEHLRSVREVTGYYVEAIDGDIGHIEDVIIDTKKWLVRYVVIDTKNWWPGKKVLVGIQWMESIDWKDSRMKFDAYRDQIKQSPEFDPSAPVNRSYEERLYDFYGRPRSW